MTQQLAQEMGGQRAAARPTQARLRGVRPVLLYTLVLLVVLAVTGGVVVALEPHVPECPLPGGACRPDPPVPPPGFRAITDQPPLEPPAAQAPIAEPTPGPAAPLPEVRNGTLWPSDAATTGGLSWSLTFDNYYWTADPESTPDELRLTGRSDHGFGWVRLVVLKRASTEMDREAMLRTLYDRAAASYDSIAIDQDLLDALRRPTIGYQPAVGLVLRGTSKEAGSVGPVAVLSVAAAYRGTTLGMQLTVDDPDLARGFGSIGRRIRVGGGYLDSVVKRVRWPDQ
ncbi:MAG: hypothetical protein QOH61_2598 [Chloroflexota bacterium]|jgi:hypothetical protein|nr:hypothetical protein [Chloroflexota bacterium]